MTTILNYSESRHYRHTGRAPIVGTTIATLAAWIAVALLGAAYAYIQLYVKLVDILSFLFVAAFAAAMAFTVYGVLKWAKVRNMAVTSLVAISAAILGMYVSWVAWSTRCCGRAAQKCRFSISSSVPTPSGAWRARSTKKAPSAVRNRPVKGTELWIAWICETLAVLAATIALPVMWLRDMAFCESCARWCSKSEAVVRVAYNGYEEKLQDRMEAKDFDYLLSLGLVHFDTPVHLRVDLYACPGCPNTHLLTLSPRRRQLQQQGAPQREGDEDRRPPLARWSPSPGGTRLAVRVGEESDRGGQFQRREPRDVTDIVIVLTQRLCRDRSTDVPLLREHVHGPAHSPEPAEEADSAARERPVRAGLRDLSAATCTSRSSSSPPSAR
jgi:hypothetical protein